MPNARSRKPRVTLKAVADRAGVAISTASLVLSGREEWLRQFHPDTVAKVRSAAERMGYRPNLFATGMRIQESSFFALVLHQVREEAVDTWHDWAFEGSLLRGVTTEATEHRLYPVVFSTHAEDNPTDVQEVARIIDGGVFGSIIRTPPPSIEEFAHRRLRRGRPIVVVFPRRLSSWPSNAIDVDNVAVGDTAARLLIAGGRRRWTLVTYEKMRDSVRLRRDGFLKAASKAGATVRTIRLPLKVSESDVAQFVAARIRKDHADGLFAVDSVSSVGSLNACVNAGLTPGSDLDLVGCDCWLWQNPHLPRPASVDISWREVGRLAVKELVRLTESGDTGFPTVLLRPQTHAGETCRGARDSPAVATSQPGQPA